MSDLQRISSFIRSFYPDETGMLNDLYIDAVSRGVPVIRQDTKELLRLLLSMKKPKRILEIGTAVGFSALFMSSCCPEAEIVTMELDPARAEEAGGNFRRFTSGDPSGTPQGNDPEKAVDEEKEDCPGRIRLLEGDASALLPQLEGSFDFFFVDAAKGQYIVYLPEVLRLAAPGAVILSDNVLQDGTILESHFLVEKRDRTIHDRMREYLRALINTPELTTSILPVGDGVAVSHVAEREQDE